MSYAFESALRVGMTEAKTRMEVKSEPSLRSRNAELVTDSVGIFSEPFLLTVLVSHCIK